MKSEEQPNVLNSAGPRPLGTGELTGCNQSSAWPLSECRDNEAIKAAAAVFCGASSVPWGSLGSQVPLMVYSGLQQLGNSEKRAGRQASVAQD